MKNLFGWITPTSRILYCDRWCHDEVLKKDNEVLKVDEVREQIETKENIGKSCQELADNGEHPEWHCYEMYDIDYQCLLSNGFIRFGSLDNRLHFEGKREVLASKLDVIKRESESNNMDYVLEPQ